MKKPAASGHVFEHVSAKPEAGIYTIGDFAAWNPKPSKKVHRLANTATKSWWPAFARSPK